MSESAVRAAWVASFIGLFSGCGGGSTNPVPPPPPPTPATITVSAGDGQVAAPGTAVATPPTVVVRSTSGAGVPNVSVTFAVDSGGGTIAAPTATTDASGVASPGAWTLGAAEGPQVLVATVTGLTPAKIRASARIPTTELASGTLGGGGGTVQVNRPGSPLNGAKLTLKAGSLSNAAAVSLAISSTAGIALRRGMTPIGPGLLITSAAGALSRPATVRFPTATPPDANTFLLAHNPRTGQTTMLPQQQADPTGISALLPALDGSFVPLPDGAAPAPARHFAAAAEEDPLLLILTSVPPEALTRDYDSGFQVGRDNWEFTNFAVAWLPFLPGASDGSPAERVIDPGSGMVATALWYFKTQRGGPPLFGRFPLQRDQPKSNKVGIRWSALASSVLYPAKAAVLQEFEDLKDESPAAFHYASLINTKQMFYTGDDRPVPLLLYDVATLTDLEDGADPDIRFAIATKIAGDQITIYVPEDANASYTLRVPRATGLEPVTILTPLGESYTVRSFVPVVARPLLDIPAVASNWPRVLDGTVGEPEGWPVPELHWKKGKLDEENLFLPDDLIQFWECPGCPNHGVTLTDVPEEAVRPQVFQVGKIVGGSMAPLTGGFRVAINLAASTVDSDVDPTKTGHHILLPQINVGSQLSAGWLDWRTVTYRRASLRPIPATVAFSKDTTINVTLNPSQPLPAGTAWSWILRTDAGRDSVATTSPTHTRSLKASDSGQLLIVAHEKDSKRPIARDSISIGTSALPYWTITSITERPSVFPPTDPAALDLIRKVVGAPRSGLVAVETSAAGSDLVLAVKASGTWDEVACCPPVALADRILLGRLPAAQHGYTGSFLNDSTYWGQTTPDLGAGRMNGRANTGSRLYDLSGPGIGPSLGPVSRWSLESSARSGSSMTGSIWYWEWAVKSQADGKRLLEPHVQRFDFAATRIR